MPAPAFPEPVNRRVLGGFVFTDATTGNSIPGTLPASSPGLLLKVNHNGVYAIFNGPGFNEKTTEFIPDPATWPAPQKFEITVSDPALRYLPRRAQINVPQSLTSLAPQPVMLYPGPSSSVELNWAVVRASVTNTAGKGLPYAFVQVIKSDSTIAATGLTDARGEALLAVMGLGVQVSSTATDPVTDSTTPVTVKAWFDPANLTQPRGWVPNPDDISTNLTNASLKTGTQTGAIGARQTLFTQIAISV